MYEEALLRDALEKMKVAITASEINEMARDLTRLSNALSLKQQKIFEDMFLNLFVRSASDRDRDAMFSI